MVSTFIRIFENKKDILFSLLFELEQNNISYSPIYCNDKLARIKVDCDYQRLWELDLPPEVEFKKYTTENHQYLSNSYDEFSDIEKIESDKNKSNLEGKLSSFNFVCEEDFRPQVESILRKCELPILYDLDTKAYRILNSRKDEFEHELVQRYDTLKSFGIVKQEYFLVENGNVLKFEKLVD